MQRARCRATVTGDGVVKWLGRIKEPDRWDLICIAAAIILCLLYVAVCALGSCWLVHRLLLPDADVSAQFVALVMLNIAWLSWESDVHFWLMEHALFWRARLPGGEWARLILSGGGE